MLAGANTRKYFHASPWLKKKNAGFVIIGDECGDLKGGSVSPFWSRNNSATILCFCAVRVRLFIDLLIDPQVK